MITWFVRVYVSRGDGSPTHLLKEDDFPTRDAAMEAYEKMAEEFADGDFSSLDGAERYLSFYLTLRMEESLASDVFFANR